MNINQDTNDKATILLLNDQFRCFGLGQGTVVMTAGVQAEGKEFVSQTLKAVVNFDKFDDDNDPWQEHDFGAIDIGSEKVFWKIDYYDLSLSEHSPNAADPEVTHRVLTIMLASEY